MRSELKQRGMHICKLARMLRMLGVQTMAVCPAGGARRLLGSIAARGQILSFQQLAADSMADSSWLVFAKMETRFKR